MNESERKRNKDEQLKDEITSLKARWTTRVVKRKKLAKVRQKGISFLERNEDLRRSKTVAR